MEFIEKRAKELYISSSGLSKPADQFGYGYPFLPYSIVFHNYYIPGTLTTLVNSTAKDRETCSIKRGDVFLTRTSETTEELGMSCVALQDYANATFNGFAKRLRPITDEIVPEYAAYFFRSPFFRAQCMSMASLITRASLNDGMIGRFRIRYPKSKADQMKIGTMLMNYDKLIEANNKRIKLLEQMAENLYKEWFVRFRFPGYETAEFENGLPIGWKYVRLFEIAKVTYGYAFSSDEFCDDQSLNAVVRIRDVPNNATNTYTSEVCSDKYLISENAILVGMDGIFHMCLWNGKKAFLNQRVVEIESNNTSICNYFLFLAIAPQVKFWEQVIAGTTVAHLGDKHLKKMTVLIPDNRILILANRILEEMMVEKNTLFKQNEYLIKQRDLLLPRLMSGKLEVN